MRGQFNSGGLVSADSGFYQAYSDHAKILRTWLVAYGIGAPVLLVTNERIAASLSVSRRAREIALCFLVGVALQVILATVNKATMWMLYRGEGSEEFRGRMRYRVSDWLSEQFWIDFVADVLAMALFAYATFRAFLVVIAE